MGRRRALSRERVLIVGGGRAAVSAAGELRRLGFRGEVVVLSEEPDPPYYRPSCSKGLLLGYQLPSDVALDLRDCQDVNWQLARRAVTLDPAARVVETNVGESYQYDGLIITTGSHAVTPPHVPMDRPGMHVLHRLEDAWALRRDLRHADSVAIVGAGLTGCEAAWAIRSLARECHLIDSKPQVMTRALGNVAGSLITEQLHKERVKLYLERRVQNVHRRRNGQWRLWLDDGTAVDADLVVMTTGERPGTAWLKGARGLDISDGVLCDESLRVVGADAIVAAGSVARWPNLRTDTTPRRAGQWITALQQGHAAARTLMAGDDPVPPVTPLNRLWSDQFGLRIQVAGDIDDAHCQVHMTQMRVGRRDVARAGMLVSYVKHDRLVGLVAVNATRAFTAVTRALLLTPQPVPLTRSGALDLGDIDRHAGRRSPVRQNGASHTSRQQPQRQQPQRQQPQRQQPSRQGPSVRHTDDWLDAARHRFDIERRAAAEDRAVEPEGSPAPPHTSGGRPERQPVRRPAARHYREQDDEVRRPPDPDPHPVNDPVEPLPEPAPQRVRSSRPARMPDYALPVDEPDVIRRASAVGGTDVSRRRERSQHHSPGGPEVDWQETGARAAERHRAADRGHARTADDEPDIIWRESTMRGASRARIAQGPESQTAEDDRDVERPKRTTRPTVRDHRQEQEPETWSYS